MKSATVGMPREIKSGERRVALVPGDVARLVRDGLDLHVESGAGQGAGYADGDYQDAGARLVEDAAQAWACDAVVKVKEPQPDEFSHFRPGLKLFCYLHLAAEPTLLQALLATGVEAYAFETLTDQGGLPLLAPMSEIAGRTAAIVAASTLAAAGPTPGRGVLAGGAAGVPPARAVVIGLGVAGRMAARGLRGLDAQVAGNDVNLDRLRDAHQEGIVTSTVGSADDLAAEVANADILIGAALVPGARAPEVVSGEAIQSMNPGSVVIDLAIDQGGCIATSRPTTLSTPTYLEHGVVHYCVTNIPGQFPRTASRALSVALVQRVPGLFNGSVALYGAINVADGRIEHPQLVARERSHP